MRAHPRHEMANRANLILKIYSEAVTRAPRSSLPTNSSSDRRLEMLLIDECLTPDSRALASAYVVGQSPPTLITFVLDYIET